MSWCQSCGFLDLRVFQHCPECDSRDVRETRDALEKLTEPAPRLIPLAAVGRDPMPSWVTHTIFDHITGSLTRPGCPLGRVILFFGPPGSGKSHHARQLLYAVREGVYFCYEERLEVVKEKFCALGPTGSLGPVFFSTSPFSAKLIESGQGVVIVDSLQLGTVGTYLDGELFERDDLGAMGSARMMVAITAEAMKLVRKHPKLIVVLIAHETKDERVAGPRTVEHMVDVSMSIHRVLSTEPSHVVTIGKNRCGPSGEWDVV